MRSILRPSPANLKDTPLSQRVTLTLLFLFVLTYSAFAASGGSYGVEFLKFKAGARPLGMGNAYTAIADDASTLFFNPAGLAQLSFPEILTMQNKWFLDLDHTVVGAVYPTQQGVFGLSYSGLNSGDIQGYDQNGSATSLFNTSSSALCLSYGQRMNQTISVGVGLKTVSEKLESNAASCLALDLGVFLQPSAKYSLGASILNLGSGLTFISENTPLPTSLNIGGAVYSKLFDEDIIIASDLNLYSDGTKINIGVEYTMQDFLSLRAGSAGGLFHSGIGLKANLFSFDYAYFEQEYLGTTHQFSISILFGEAERAKKLVIENLSMGKAYFEQGRFADAMLKFDKVMVLDPKNEEVRKLYYQAQISLEKQDFEKVYMEIKAQEGHSVAEILASGNKFMLQKNYLEAITLFSKALVMEPTNINALKLQSEAQTKMEAQLILQAKDEARAYLGEAMKFITVGKYKDALAQINLALEKDSRNAQALQLKRKLETILNLEKK